jgi:hypothetical protein
MTAFFVVSTQWASNTMPNNDLHNILLAKARTMIDAGQLVKGTLPHDGQNVYPQGYTNATHPERNAGIADKTELTAFATNLIMSYDDATRTVSGTWPTGETQKYLRIFTSEEAATEWNLFTLKYGALSSVILTAEEIAALPGIILPDDSVIQQYVTTTV